MQLSELLHGFNSALFGTPDSSMWQELEALQNEALYAAIKIIAETMASLPISVFRKTADGPQKVTDHHLAKALNNPNPNTNKFSFWETFLSHVLLRGNGYAFIDRWPNSGRVRDLIILDPTVIEPFLNERMEKQFRNTITQKIYGKDQVFHVMATSWDGLKGLSPIQQFKRQIAEGLGADEYIKNFFEKGILTNIVLTLPEGYAEDAEEKPAEYKRRIMAMKSQFVKMFGGRKNQGEPVLLDEGFKLETLKQDSNKDNQVLELRKEAVIKIARIFRIPPHMLMSLDKATYSNIGQQSADFYKQCILPWIERMESAIESQLLYQGVDGDLYIKYNASSVLRGTDQERKEFYKTMHDIGALSINEIRALEELPRLKSKYADYHAYNLGTGFIEEPTLGKKGEASEV